MNRLLTSFSSLALALLIPVGGGAAETPGSASQDKELAKELREEIRKASPDRYMLLLRACIEHAQKYGQKNKAKATENPFYRILAACIASDRPARLRVAVVKAVTSPVPNRKTYQEGVKLLLDYLGQGPRRFRESLRSGLAVVEFQNREEILSELEKLLAGGDPTRPQVEDAAYLLWEEDPVRTIKSLIKGLSVREKEKGDVAPYHWVLRKYLRHREKSAEAWGKYFQKNLSSSVLRETHAIREKISSELLVVWESCVKALRQASGEKPGLAAYWQFLRRTLDSTWPELRVRACREIGNLVAGRTVGTLGGKQRDGLEREQLETLLQMIGAGSDPRYEPLAVRLEALRAIRFLEEAARSEPELSKRLSGVIGGKQYERAFCIHALRTAGELGLAALQEPIAQLILKYAEQEAGSLEVITEAVSALGRIGLGSSDGKTERADELIEVLLELYRDKQDQETEQSVRLCEAVVKSLGRIGDSGSKLFEVKKFLRGVLQKKQKKKSSLTIFTINSLGELRDSEAVGVLSNVLASRASLGENVVQAAVNALCLIGSSEEVGALESVIKVLVQYLGTGDSEFSSLLARKLHFLCRNSIDKMAKLSLELVKQEKFQSAVDILSGKEAIRLRRVALMEGSEKELRALWDVEKSYLEALERLERFDLCLSEIAKLRESNRFEALRKIPGKLAWEGLVARITAKKNFTVKLNSGEVSRICEGFKNLLGGEGELVDWALGKIEKSEKAEEVNKALLQDSAVPADVKDKLKPPGEGE